MTQRSAATYLDVSESHLSNYLGYRRALSTHVYLRIEMLTNSTLTVRRLHREEAKIYRPDRRDAGDEALIGALIDPNAKPLTDLARMKRVPRAKTIRRALGFSQEEFAARYRIPLGTLRDWEQGRAEPDQTARAYLEVIAAEPEAAARAHERAGVP